MSMKSHSRWLPFLQWPRLTPALARSELLAGITVGLVMVPQAVAYAGLAHMPLGTGRYACGLPAWLAGLGMVFSSLWVIGYSFRLSRLMPGETRVIEA